MIRRGKRPDKRGVIIDYNERNVVYFTASNPSMA